MIIDKLNVVINGSEYFSVPSVLSHFTIQHMSEIPEMSISSIASQTGVTKGQISKFVRQLNFEDFKEFKWACEDYIESLSKNDSETIGCTNLSSSFNLWQVSQQQLFREFTSNVDFEQLNTFLEKLTDQKYVYLYAQADSKFLVQRLQQLLTKKFITSSILDRDAKDIDLIHTEGILIILSASGETFKFDKNVIEQFEKFNGERWLLSSQVQNTIEFKQLIIKAKASEAAIETFNFLFSFISHYLK